MWFRKLLNKKPWKIYQLRLTDYFSSLPIFSVQDKYIECLGEFMKVFYVYCEEKKRFKNKNWGINEKNRKNSNWEQKSLSNITVNYLKYCRINN